MDSINTKRSYTEYEVTEPTTDFAIGFDNYSGGDKDAIHVTLDGMNLDNLDYTVVRKNAQVIEVTPAIESGVVRIQRETAIDQAFHKFTAGALFSPKSMDENFEQIRHSQQEINDGFTFLAENTNGVVQASKEATAQAKAATVEATASAVRAESAADTAVQAVDSLQGVVDAATTATTEANTATATATTAASQATAATTSAQDAAQAATVAKQEAAAAARTAEAATVNTLAATDKASEAADLVTDLVVGKVHAQDVSTADGSTQEIKNTQFRNELDAIPFEGGVLDATFVSMTPKGSGGIARNLRDVNSDVVSVKDFGAQGDGVTDDSIAIQAALDYVTSIYLSTDKAGTVFFPDGVYVFRLVKLRAGCDLKGSGATVFLKTPMGSELESSRKWWRMLSSEGSNFDTVASKKHRINISDIIFDGNLENMGWSGSYSQEQAHCLFLGVANTQVNHADDRVKFNITNCKFINSVADGISVHINSDVTFTNIEAQDCFRGGFTATGGNSIAKGRDYVGKGARIDFEVDGAGFGGDMSLHYQLDSMQVSASDSMPDRDGIDFGGVGASGSGLLTNSTIEGDFNFHNSNSLHVISENCTFYPNQTASNSNRFYGCIGTFKNCKFIVKNSDTRLDTSLIALYARKLAKQEKPPELLFDGCSFTVLPDAQANTAIAKESMFYTTAYPYSFANEDFDGSATKVVFKDCHIGKGFSNTFKVGQGGVLVVDNCTSLSEGGYIYSGQSTGRPSQVTIKGSHSLINSSHFVTGNAQAYQEGGFINFDNCWTDNPTVWAGDITKGSIQGIYNYYVTDTPSNEFAYYNAKAHFKPVITGGVASHREARKGVLSWTPRGGATNATRWGVSEQIQVSSTTELRPAGLSNNDYGYRLFDTTLNKMIWWDGIKWLDYMGEVV